MVSRAWQCWLACGLVSLTAGCARPAFRAFSPEGPQWVDLDQRTFSERPAEYFSPFAWDAADQTLFRPLTRVFAVAPGGEAVNVNAVDEVPDSSWFRNRIGRRPMSPPELALGSCRERPIDPRGPWTVTGAKPNGANPGFIVEDQYGRRFLLKFDGVVQGPRATSADVVVSKLYHAAGYYTPCNEVVFFDREILEIDPEATGENAAGKEEPLTDAHLDLVFAKAIELPDGRYRASASLFIEGQPLGPWRYQGRRRDDPNDVVRHEDRRELRGARVLAGWTHHFDSREQNTMATWVDRGAAGGYVRHYYIDFGDCLGSIWEPPMLGRRIGHSSYFDPAHVVADFVTLGSLRRPWDEARFGPSGPVFGYYDVESFSPDRYHPGYPNPAFARMTERDASWMARIISQISDDHLRAAIATARMRDPFLEVELFRLLKGRRDVLLHRYLTRLSPLAHPTIRVAEGAGDPELCVRDLALEAGVSSGTRRYYGARAWGGTRHRSLGELGAAIQRGPSQVCVPLPTEGADDGYLVVDVYVGNDPGDLLPPARVHLSLTDSRGFAVVGLERPDAGVSPR